MKETYDNLKVLFELTNFNNISYKFVSDYKLLLIINRQQTATAAYPCPYCFVSLSGLRDNGKNCESGLRCDKWSLMHTNKNRVLKNVGHLSEDYEKYDI